MIKFGIPLIVLGVAVSCPPAPPNTNPSPSPSIPTTTTTLAPTPEATPTPTVKHCPVKLPTLHDAPGGPSLYILRKLYGQGLDCTPRVRDHEYCSTLYSDPGNFDCKANPEGSGQDACDWDFLGQHCPTWYFLNPYTKAWEVCRDGEHPIASCDHFDHWIEWTKDSSGATVYNPYTGLCDVNAKHEPVTGFFMIPHGNTDFKACDATGMICSEPIHMDQ